VGPSRCSFKMGGKEKKKGRSFVLIQGGNKEKRSRGHPIELAVAGGEKGGSPKAGGFLHIGGKTRGGGGLLSGMRDRKEKRGGAYFYSYA